MHRTGVVDFFAGGQNDPAALLLQTTGFDGAAVFDHAANQAVHGLRAQNDQAARGLHGPLVVDQGLDLAGLHTDAGQAVVAVKVQVNRFACGQGHRAHLGNDGALVAHFGREQGDVAPQGGFDFAFVDDTAFAAVAFIPVFTGHEVGVADAVRGGHDTAHIDPGIFAKVNPGRVGQDDLAVGRDAAKNLTRVVGHDTVERDAAGPGLLKLNVRVFAHVESLPIDRRAVRALLDDHVGTRGVDVGLAGAQLSAGGQGCGHRLRRRPTARGQQCGGHQRAGAVDVAQVVQRRHGAERCGHGLLQARHGYQADVVALPQGLGVF